MRRLAGWIAACGALALGAGAVTPGVPTPMGPEGGPILQLVGDSSALYAVSEHAVYAYAGKSWVRPVFFDSVQYWSGDPWAPPRFIPVPGRTGIFLIGQGVEGLGGIRRLDTAGGSWTLSADGLAGAQNALAIGDTLWASRYIANHYELSYSLDGGKGWTAAGPAASGPFFEWPGGLGYPYSDSLGDSLVRVGTRGWRSYPIPPGTGRAYLDVRGGSFLLLPTRQEDSAKPAYFSSDGIHWIPKVGRRPDSMDIQRYIPAIFHRNGSILVQVQDYSGRGALYRSADSGATWERLDLGPAAWDIRSFAEWRGRVYAATGAGVFAFTPDLRSWEPVTTGLSTWPIGTLVQSEGSLFALAPGGRPFRYRGGGAWAKDSFPDWGRMHQNSWLSAGPRRRYLGPGPDTGMWILSGGDGLPWRRLPLPSLPSGAPVVSGDTLLIPSSGHPGARASLFSPDGGRTFRPIGFSTDSGGIGPFFTDAPWAGDRISATAPLPVRASVPGLFLTAYTTNYQMSVSEYRPYGLFRLDSATGEWRASGISGGTVDQVVGTGNLLFARARYQAVTTWVQELHRSRDGGNLWEIVPAGGISVPTINGLYDMLWSRNRLYLAANTGLLVSEDSGASFAKLGGGFLPRPVLALAEQQDTLYIGTSEGLYALPLGPAGTPVRRPVPAPGALALSATAGPGNLRVSFTLPARARAALRVLSPDGRLLATRDLGWREAGQGTAEVTLPPSRGLYLLRLEAGGMAATARALRAD